MFKKWIALALIGLFLIAISLALIGLFLTAPATAGRLLEKRLVATRDFAAAPAAYSELVRYDLKAGKGDVLMMRVEVTGVAGGTTGLVVVAVPVWDRAVTADVLKPINFVVGNGGAGIDSVVTAVALDNMYVFTWGDGTVPPLGPTLLPPYISIQTREEFTGGTLNLYMYLVAR